MVNPKLITMKVGNFSDSDGTIIFYLRVKSLLVDNCKIIDFGAGRGAWMTEDNCKTRREIRDLRSKTRRVVGMDIDDAIFENRSVDDTILFKNSHTNEFTEFADVIVCDFVLEHVTDPTDFAASINKMLKPGGWLCARTPHKYNYVSMLSALISNSLHTRVLKFVQPNRKEQDVFDAFYKMNTISDIERIFPDWNNQSYIFRGDPAYFWGNKVLFKFLCLLHRLLPSALVGTLFIFVQKPYDKEQKISKKIMSK